MLFHNALLGGLMLAGYASAKTPTVNALFQRSEDIEDVLRRDADMMATLTRRQDANGVGSAPKISTTPASGDAAKADLAKWEEQTKAACGTALTALNGQASNPSGIAVCYNLPFLDNQTGIFQAELRMYNISAPIDPWVGISAADVNMALSYLGATVQNMNGTFAKRDITDFSYPPIRERDVEGTLVERQAAAPAELKVLMYVGKINSNLMGSAMTQATLQPLLVPNIELSAKNPKTGEDVKATLSSQEASFVNGVFAKQTSPTPTDAAALASASAAVISAAPFVVPGQRLDPRVTKAGLIVTLVWAVGFMGVVGLGTYGRIQFREQYRRRVKNEAARTMRTI
ncbi:hypothetical protein BU23DRAFT_578445 [Bimuria novae-zelandiae CBS 107.79]|uniref:Uncharacterized protein n=1 Tax=Bimuria novae-zelandiae CBS 107.79 TaxID=1447943 RepID=A0A6A5VNG1_9PLEO|nr:hypothetical protein BU23DRAFT_578445 [Bimuria novae-zelandiae CBS 107.79]